MEPLISFMLGVAIFLAVVLLLIYSALIPAVPLKGKTNLPNVPELVCLPVLGHAWKFLGVSSTKELWETINKLASSNVDRAVSIWLGPKLIVSVQDPKLNEAILNNPKSSQKDPDFYGFFHKFMGGVFSRNGKGWKELRRPLDKFLTLKAVTENYFDIFVSKYEETSVELDKQCGKGVFDVHPYMQRCSLDITIESIMGIPSTHEKHIEFNPHWINRMTEFCFRMVMTREYKFSWLFKLSGAKKEMDAILSYINSFAKKLVNSRVDFLDKAGLNPEDLIFEPECYADVAIQLARKEKLEHYRLPYDLVVAGTDTSAVSLSSACLFLAQHPEIQERAYREQIQIMGNTLRAPTQEELSKMDYLWMVYQETLRHVGVPGVVRQLNAQLSVDDVDLPEGASIYVAMHTLNMDPKYWVKTKEFYPENFLPEHVEKRPKGAFLPFSSGARSCPGKMFAVISSRIILSMLLRRYEFTTSLDFKDMEWEYQLMIESTKGYPIQLRRREENAEP